MLAWIDLCFYLMRYQAIPCADNGSFTILTQTISMKVKQHRTKPAKRFALPSLCTLMSVNNRLCKERVVRLMLHTRDLLIFVHKHAAIPSGLFTTVHCPVCASDDDIQRFSLLRLGNARSYRYRKFSVRVVNRIIRH